MTSTNYQIRFIVIIVVQLFFALNSSAQQIGEHIKSIPYVLSVYNSPAGYTVHSNEVVLSAMGKTNLFNNPNKQSKVSNAPLILFEPAGDFTLSAKVTGELKAVYDVAALVVFQDEDNWAKLCYENSVTMQPTIVSVVTRSYSDDCNSQTTNNWAYLSIVKKDDQYSFFYSADGVNWNLIRHFNLETKKTIKVGFASHGSRGEGFTGIFSDIKYQDRALENMRGI